MSSEGKMEAGTSENSNPLRRIDRKQSEAMCCQPRRNGIASGGSKSRWPLVCPEVSPMKAKTWFRDQQAAGQWVLRGAVTGNLGKAVFKSPVQPND